MTLWALHGFLGQVSDFSNLQKEMKSLNSYAEWKIPDYVRTRELSPANPVKNWGLNFNRWVASTESQKPERVLLGYSQGGRLALEAVKQDPAHWKALILLSANPGIPQAEKPARLKSDQEWANRFLNENFAKTVQKWNSQSVFRGSVAEPVRQESDYNRHQLADALVNWSVAQQDDFRDFLMKIQIPVLYLVGENDTKYCQIGSELKRRNPALKFYQVPQAGHRVLFDQPKALAIRIDEFLKSI